jgi:ABC-type sugar transport system permease subunit
VKTWAALLLILPALASFGLGFGAPMVMVGRLALFETDYVIEKFVGLKNFAEIFRDKQFLGSFVNVLIFVVPLVPITILLTYGTASMLSRFGDKAQSWGRFVSYIPSLTTGLIVALLWRWLLKRDGMINQFIVSWGGTAVGWLSQPWTARLSMILVSLSTGPGAFIILCGAAMKSIPQELHDAAVMDGASESQYRRFVVRPILMPTILLMVLLVLVGTMQAWESIYVLTGTGGPKGSTATPVYNLFQTAFVWNRPGYAAAKGIILLVVIGVMVFIKQRVEKWAGAEG